MSRFEPPTDQYGRFILPDPTTGRDRPYTRTTTLVKAISDTSALDRWKQRMVLTGAARKPELLDVARGSDERDVLDSLCSAALDAAGANKGSDAGTTLHAITEKVDAGENIDIPDEYKADVAAYVAKIAECGIVMIPEYIERRILNTTVDVTGTFDRIVQLPDGRLVIADLKTAKSLDFGKQEIAAQLATYSNANYMYDDSATGNPWIPMPDIDKTEGVVFHLPVGQGRCTLHMFDLVTGWKHAKLAGQVRAARSHRNISYEIDPVEFRAAGIHTQIRQATNREQLAALWHLHSPSGSWTNDHTIAASDRKQELAA